MNQTSSSLKANAKSASWSRHLMPVCFLVILCSFVAYRLSRPSVTSQLPTDRIHSLNQGWVDEKRCAECHEEAETFWETGHAQTLRPVNDSHSLELLKQMNTFLAAQGASTSIHFDDDTVVAVHERDGKTSQIQLDWCFGSGEHARTWVGTLTDSNGATDLVEFHWTWYHDVDSFDITPGQPEETGSGYFAGLGLLSDAPKARKCFACHSSYLPVKTGKIHTEALHPGVTCQRCHGPRQAHVDSEGEITDSFWKNASQLESIHRCAECHRRAEEQVPEDVNKQNHDIARFQPVGLVQSPCFQGSQMTCLTCHNPHLTLKAQDSLGIWQCTQCHDGTESKHSLCAAGHVERCLECHMPKVKMKSPLEFTDHWIRIRHESESAK